MSYILVHIIWLKVYVVVILLNKCYVITLMHSKIYTVMNLCNIYSNYKLCEEYINVNSQTKKQQFRQQIHKL